MKKKVIAMALGISMSAALVACGEDNRSQPAIHETQVTAQADLQEETIQAAEETSQEETVQAAQETSPDVEGETEAAASEGTASESGSSENEETAPETASTEDIATEDIASETDASEAEEHNDGEWEINQGSLSLDDHKDAKEAFEKATANIDGYEYEAVACLGTQLVAGRNYSYLCRGTEVYPGAKPEYMIVTVYTDPEGNAQITDVKDFPVDGGDYSYTWNEDADGEDDDITGEKESPSENDVNVPGTCHGGANAADEGDEDNTNTVLKAGAASSGQTDQMPDPFTEVSTLEEAASMTGFTLAVPDAPAEYPDVVIRVMDSSMIEVIYGNNEKKIEGYRIRKAEGSDDISGDYNIYADSHTEKIDGRTVTVKGDGNTISVAIWNQDGYTYAVDTQDHPMSLADVTAVISAIR